MTRRKRNEKPLKIDSSKELPVLQQDPSGGTIPSKSQSDLLHLSCLLDGVISALIATFSAFKKHHFMHVKGSGSFSSALF